MPGEDTGPTVAAEAQEVTQALLKIVQNKIRNLRKAVDKASAIEKAAENGDKLQADQLESVAAKPGKLLLLDELEELLKKQTTVVASHLPARKSRKRGGSQIVQKPGTEPIADHTPDVSSSRAAVDAGSVSAEPEAGQVHYGSGEVASLDGSSDVSACDHFQERCAVIAVSESSSEYLASERPEIVTNGAAKRAADFGTDLTEKPSSLHGSRIDVEVAISKVLSLLHVVDFINAPESKQCVVDFFASDQGRTVSRIVSAYDLELISYFVVMLTSPNGDVPHEAAVETSTAHCLAYVEGCDGEAFTGTTYSTLSEIVQAVEQSPPLATRGRPLQPSSSVEHTRISFGRNGAFVAEDSAIAAVGAAVRPQSAEAAPAANIVDRSRGNGRGGRGGVRHGSQRRRAAASRAVGEA
jgi:hypothetical protein